MVNSIFGRKVMWFVENLSIWFRSYESYTRKLVTRTLTGPKLPDAAKFPGELKMEMQIYKGVRIFGFMNHRRVFGEVAE